MKITKEVITTGVFIALGFILLLGLLGELWLSATYGRERPGTINYVKKTSISSSKSTKTTTSSSKSAKQIAEERRKAENERIIQNAETAVANLEYHRIIEFYYPAQEAVKIVNDYATKMELQERVNFVYNAILEERARIAAAEKAQREAEIEAQREAERQEQAQRQAELEAQRQADIVAQQNAQYQAQQQNPQPVQGTTPQQSPKTHYPNCTAAQNAGVGPIYRGQDGYGVHLDRDGDGIACEWNK
ncbi:excalibur calcium-binding domain-containing protein [Streptococcus sp. zg-JUN1979]|uniref:excalibur calcium-binding domain-containing protein n=1 Tax=Streptococcus sp. zg-JUN1979 TaxID=3391450 RepID=UPI0039A5F7A1